MYVSYIYVHIKHTFSERKKDIDNHYTCLYTYIYMYATTYMYTNRQSECESHRFGQRAFRHAYGMMRCTYIYIYSHTKLLSIF